TDDRGSTGTAAAPRRDRVLPTTAHHRAEHGSDLVEETGSGTAPPETAGTAVRQQTHQIA
ncbi:MAG: hypothetical protein ABL997_14685, partial [Planctomycetota bacterium]